MAEENATTGGAQLRSVPVDWEALEDAFENNAPEVHSYLHLQTGEVLRIVDGVADPQMHARIAADTNYLRIDPVSSREQYRWMERYIPMVEDAELRAKLAVSIDGKGAFRRFKDVLMAYGTERERWFAFRSERLRIFMEAWLNAHALHAVARPVVVAEPVVEAPVVVAPPAETKESVATASSAPEVRDVRRVRSSETMRKAIREAAEGLGPRDLETLLAFSEFLRSRRAARTAAQATDGGDDKDRASGAPAAPEPERPRAAAASAPASDANGAQVASSLPSPSTTAGALAERPV